MKIGNKAVQSDYSLQQARKKAVHAELARKGNTNAFENSSAFAAHRLVWQGHNV